MCYNIALTVDARQVAQRYNKKSNLMGDFQKVYHVSAFSHNEYPIITIDDEVQMFRWGLIPFWVEDIEDALQIRNRTINARAETIFKKPSFREPIKKKRCLLPVTGFFDYRHDGERKTPYYITVKDKPVFSLAGMYDVWHNPITNEAVPTFSIITTEANEMMRYIHNTNFRMPVILPLENESRWLDPTLSETDITGLLRPFKNDDMGSYVIGNDFIKKSPYDSTILDKVQPAV